MRLELPTIRSRDDVDGNIVQRVLEYEPSKPAAGAFAGLYLALGIVLLIRTIRTKSWWGLCLPIGAIAVSFGLVVRILLVSNPNSVGVFAAMQVLVTCSPAAFLAFNYIVYGRWTQCIDRKHSYFRPNLVSKIFVISDVSTFLIQATGGALETSPSAKDFASKIFLAGLILQSISYVIFVVLVALTHRSILKSNETTGEEPWWIITKLLYFSSFFIVIRCIYRVIELGQGFGGYLLTHEVYLYVFDLSPLFLAVACYAWIWPSPHITPYSSYAMTSVTSLPKV